MLIRQHLLGLAGFTLSATLSYGLVVALGVFPSVGLSPAPFTEDASNAGLHATPRPDRFRSDVTWHGDSLVTTDPRSTECSVTGTRYTSPTGERAFHIRREFGSTGAAKRALERVRGRAMREAGFESGMGSIGRYFPQYYLQFDPKREFAYDPETEFEQCDHAVVWLEGDRLLGVYGPDFDTVRALYMWTRTQPN